ncbi:MAG: pyridoxamine 5'-phosphate oxidase family protein [Nitrospiraceae bacterium]
MTSIYHPGELAVQARAGVQVMACRVDKTIRYSIPTAAADFLGSQPMAVAGTVDARGRVWASLLTGSPGFMHLVDEETFWIDSKPVSGDPLGENLREGAEIGLLVIDLATRRRMRVNGKAKMQSDGSVVIHTKQVYSNCPKYIQVRVLDPAPYKSGVPHSIRCAETLTREQQQWITRADTFFIASFHPEGGADASHRGGNPGFVRILDGRTIQWPDYAGNNMFQTLGNMAVNPQAGLLFLDFERGSTLQLTGQAQIIWDKARVVEFAGAERLVEFRIEQIIEIAGASPLRWRLVERSPFNPA